MDFVRSLYEAWSRGDWSPVEWAHPEIEFVAADGPAPGSSRGLADMEAFWRDFLGAWEDYRVEPEDYRELDGDRVLVFIRIRGRGKASGLEVERMGAKGANLVHLRDGKVTRLVLYWDRERALADAGLAP
jgi:ketosteroid isomerase-like protein